MACECDGFARQSSKLLDKVRFLGELLGSVNCEVRSLKFHTSNFPLQTSCGVVRERAQRRSLNLRDCGFESRLRHSIVTWIDWTWESMPSVKRSLSMSNVGSIPSRPTDVNLARCDVGICSQPLKLAFTGSIPVRVTQAGFRSKVSGFRKSKT